MTFRQQGLIGLGIALTCLTAKKLLARKPENRRRRSRGQKRTGEATRRIPVDAPVDMQGTILEAQPLTEFYAHELRMDS